MEELGWVNLSQDRDKQRAVVQTLTNLRVSYNACLQAEILFIFRNIAAYLKFCINNSWALFTGKKFRLYNCEYAR